MSYPILLFIIYINETIITTPIVRMNDTIRVNFSVYFATSLENIEHDRFSTCTTFLFPFNTPSAKIRFILNW